MVDIDEPGRLLDMQNPTSVSTANGSLAIDKYVKSYVPSLETTLDVVVTECTPDVVSLGKLCREHGYNFEWRGHQKQAENVRQERTRSIHHDGS